jgi:hypothetical protein
MKDEGWTLSDLAGELWARGLDIEDVTIFIDRVLDCPTAERAAAKIESLATGSRD